MTFIKIKNKLVSKIHHINNGREKLHRESQQYACDMNNYRSASFRVHPEKSDSTAKMKSKKEVSLPGLAICIKLFIVVSISADLYCLFTNQNLPRFMLEAEAGSKSSKSSQKTTVIAIDGSGGGGHAHPVPMPWPVVHCHHHHHHLKYVPKPVLIHHWVKKHKLPVHEIAASEKHPLELSPESPPEFYNSMALPSSFAETYTPNLENGLASEYEDKNRLISDVGNAYVNHLSSQPQQSFPLMSVASTRVHSPMSPAKEPLFPLNMEFEQELKKLKARKRLQSVANDISSKQLKSLTIPLSPKVYNSKKPFDTDTESDDSFIYNVVDSSTGSNASSKSLNPSSIDGGIVDLTEKVANKSNILVHSSTHPVTISRFDSRYHQKNHNRRESPTPNEFQLNLERANKLEQRQSEQLYEKLASEHESRLQALTAVNQLLNTGLRQPQANIQTAARLQPQQGALQIGQQLGPYLYPNPQSAMKPHPIFNAAFNTGAVVSSRAATALTESKTIETMIKLAEHMARAEARRSIAEHQRKLIGKSVSKNEPVVSRGLLKRLNLFGALSQPALMGHHRNRQRRDSPPAIFNHASIQDLLVAPLSSKLKTNQAQPEPRVIRSFNLKLRPDSRFGNRVQLPERTSGLMMKQYAEDFMSGQPSNSMNKIVDPPKELKRDSGAKGKELDSPKDLKSTTIYATNSQNQDTSNFQTTMSPLQEGDFYLSQQNHILKTNRQHQISPSTIAEKTRIYNSMPSDLHNFFVEPPLQSADLISSLGPEGTASQPGALINRTKTTNIAKQTAQSAQALAPSSSNPPWNHEQPLGSNIQPDYMQWKHPRNLRSTQDQIQPSSSKSNQVMSDSSVTDSDAGRLYQNFVESMIPLPSYLEFPMSPQLWSTKAMESINAESSNNTSSIGSNDGSEVDQEKGADSSQSDQNESLANELGGNQQAILYDSLNGQNPMALEHMMQAANSPEHLQPNLIRMPSSGQPSSYEMEQLAASSGPFLMPNLPSQLFAGPHTMSADGAQNSNNIFGGASQYSPMYSMYDSQAIGKLGKGLSMPVDNGELMEASFNGPSRVINSNVGPFGGLGQQQDYDPMEVATADMRQLTNLRNSLSQNVGPTNNLTSMTRFSRQIRDQMNNLPGQGFQMPQIPNIPQPPQIPNLPMPPPGMMQMAGLALPFAMARATREANRVRNQQVNAAAAGGGTSAPNTSQRIFNRALTWTNRMTRSRRRPTSAPTSSSSSNNPTRNRNRIRSLVQTVVDMSRRPPGTRVPAASTSNRILGAASSLTKSPPKLKPKIDDDINEVRGRRRSRAINRLNDAKASHERDSVASKQASDSKQAMILPGSVLATDAEGNLARFASMTSPVDILASQLTRLTHANDGHEANDELHNFEVIDERPRRRHKSMANGLVPVPVVANHFNLLMLTAQNITGHLVKQPEDQTTSNPVQQQQEQLNQPPPPQHEQEQQQQQDPQNDQHMHQEQQHPQQVSSSEGEGSVSNEARLDSNFFQQNSSDQANERETAVLESQTTSQGQAIVADSRSFSEQSPHFESKLQRVSKNKKVVTEKAANEEPTTLSLFTVKDKSQDRSITPAQTQIDQPKKTELEQYKSEASIVDPIQTKDSFRLSVGASVQTGNVSQLMPITSFNQVEPPNQLLKSKWRKNPSKELFRSHGPNKFSIKSSHQHSKTDTSAMMATTTTTNQPIPVPNLNLMTSEAITTTTDHPRQPGTSSAPADDYVRAIKLVRGAAYPWPPPTKSSKMIVASA